MPNVTKLSHAVLFISNLERSRPFYEKAFGLQFVAGRPGAAFFRIPGGEDHHNLALMEVGAGAPIPPQGAVGLYHLAWEVDSIDALAAAIEPLVEMGALVGASDHGATKSLYGKSTPTALSSRYSGASPAKTGVNGRTPSQRAPGPAGRACPLRQAGLTHG